MNHLAHVLLAGPSVDHRLGAFLGDHVKGRLALAELPVERARGVLLHRRIDAWSDAHPAVVALRARCGPGWRRYSGVILDVLFDAMLVRHWSRFGPEPLERFAEGIDAMLAEHRDALPERLRLFSRWARRVRLWRRYDDRAMLEEIFERLAARHGRPGPLADGVRLLDAMEPGIEAAFGVLFPDLERRSRAFLASTASETPGAGAAPADRIGY
jgi:acyl carrier protein phosphodiesterase